MEKYKISIATGCYNSQEFIERTFQSIVDQHYRNLEWNVVVDGETDSTRELLEGFRARAAFPINVTVFPSNRGSAAAISTAVHSCTGEFTMILDHDDELMPRAIHDLMAAWDSVARTADTTDIYAVTGRCVNEKNEFLGRRTKPAVIVSSLGHFFYVKRGSSECFSILRTDVLKKYYHFAPEEVGSTNGLIWNRMARHRRAIFTNLIVRRYHTNVAGSWSNNKRIRAPIPWANQELEALNDNSQYFLWAPLVFLKKLAIYQRYSYHANRSVVSSIRALRDRRMRIAAACVSPLALWMALNDQRSGRAP